MNILNFSSSTKFSDVSYETLQDKFSLRMEQVGCKMVLVLINLTALQLEVGGREVKKSRRTEGREGGQGQTKLKKDNVDVRSGGERRGRERQRCKLYFQSYPRGLPIPQPKTKICRNLRKRKQT